MTDKPRGGRRRLYRASVALLALVAAALLVVFVKEVKEREIRAQVDAAHRRALAMQQELLRYYRAHGGMPPRAIALLASPQALEAPAAPAPQPYTLAVDSGTITIVFGTEPPALAGKTLVYRPQIVRNALQWDCSGGTVDFAWRAPECRGR